MEATELLQLSNNGSAHLVSFGYPTEFGHQ
jgi:hypothetical protein